MARPDRCRCRAWPCVAQLAERDDGLASHRTAGQCPGGDAAPRSARVRNGSRGLPAFGMTAFLGESRRHRDRDARHVRRARDASGSGDRRRHRRLRGLAHRSAPAALLLTVAVATLAGVPPLAGFLTRVLLISSAADTHYGWLAIVAIAATVLTMIAGCAIHRDAVRGCRRRGALHARRNAGALAHCRGAACLAGVVLVVLIQPLLAVATAGAGTLR